MKEDLEHFGLLGKAKLSVPKSREEDFDAKLFMRMEDDEKKKSVSFCVLPQPAGIQFISEEIKTKRKGNDLTIVRLVWNAYARYLLKYAESCCESNSPMGCEAFADKIAKAAAEQKLTKVCIDLDAFDYDKTFGNMFVPALSERGIDVLVKKERSRDCLNDFKNKGRKGICGLYKDEYNDIW